MIKNNGGSDTDILCTIFGVCFAGSIIEIMISRFIPFFQKIITPLVSGIVVTLIGLSLIKVAITDFGGGFWLLKNKPESFASYENLSLGFIVLITIILLNRSNNKYLRMGSIVIALLIGYLFAILLGLVDFSSLSTVDLITIPLPCLLYTSDAADE